MRPDYLLNFLALSPSAADVREAYRSVFPTLLGVKLAKRLHSEPYHKLLAKAAEAERMEKGRMTAEIARLSDHLKSDLSRQFLTSLEDES